ncbi:copper resistance protein CopC [Actinomadura viridis]|uniref:Methionine-rich copper-binding protein CopC n=1 Tax=Actinomadura viridis TaxID=58110 RepID=A0A931GLV7_9ACTN|nr:copper resistance CopC family protein [Actinomadura viridis]MBG6091952.1 methionine-rich copper-binding protein CopC [Actinomadura viridis]
MRAPTRAGLAGALAAATLTLGAVPASAHTALKSSDPKDGAEIASPSEIVLTYNENVRVPRVALTGPDGNRYEAGAAKAVDTKVTQPVNGTLPNGTYTVGWRVVSVDGHPVTGTFKFTVKGSDPASTPSSPGERTAPVGDAAASPTAPASPSTAAESSESTSSGWWWIGLGALVIALVAGGVSWARRGSSET